MKYSSELLPKMHQKLSVAKLEVHLGWVQSLLSHLHKQILLRKINMPQKRWTMRQTLRLKIEKSFLSTEQWFELKDDHTGMHCKKELGVPPIEVESKTFR